MKVALVHDYIKEYGGAERVLETLLEIFPNSPVFTSVYCPAFLGPHKKRFASYDIRPSFLQYLPFKAKLISPIRLIAPFVFSTMELDDYDAVIVSATGAYSPNTIDKGKAKHIVYCHTPPRYLYGYMTARNWKRNKIIASLAHVANHFLRMIDYHSNQKPNAFIANSQEVARRIEKFYRRNSVVIYPPVEIPKIKLAPIGEREYFVAGGRLARAKRVDFAIKAANELKLPLKIFGKGFAGYDDTLKQLAGETVEFLGEISDQQKFELLANAKAYISPSVDEDFGILNVEAMACGTPVIGHNSGGTRETVIVGKTGILFNQANTKSLITAIKKLQKTRIDPRVCRDHAKKFSKERFKREIKEFVLKSSHA